MISIISGLPGKGKNVYATHLAKKHFRSENNFFNRIIRRITHSPIIINNVYSTYPILLKKYSKRSKKENIYSNIISLYDLNGKYKFQYNSLIIVDETQSFYDSDEFKEFPKEIAVFHQFHRHFNIKDIYHISQHPSRVVKKLRNVACKFIKIRSFIVIPFIKIGIMYYSNYYEFEDYGKWHHPVKEAKTYDVDNHFLIFNSRKVFSSYNSKYLNVLNKDKPVYDKGYFKGKELSVNDLKSIFGNKISF